MSTGIIAVIALSALIGLLLFVASAQGLWQMNSSRRRRTEGGRRVHCSELSVFLTFHLNSPTGPHGRQENVVPPVTV